MTEPVNRKKFEELLKRWIVIEDSTIDSANELIGQSKNPLTKTIIDLIKRDSEKHKHILEAIRLSLDSATVFSPEDLMVVDSFVEKHATLEKNAVETAEQAMEMSSLPIPKFLLSHLLDDEKSHDKYMEELTNLKAYMAKDT
jgi:DNA-binding ferritin-like protein